MESETCASNWKERKRMTEKNNIPPEDHARMMRYLNGEMSHEEQHEYEKEHSEDPFLEDAMEGLQNFGSRDKRDKTVHSINASLRQQLTRRKPRRNNKAAQPVWLYFSIILILLIAVIAFVVIRYYR